MFNGLDEKQRIDAQASKSVDDASVDWTDLDLVRCRACDDERCE